MLFKVERASSINLGGKERVGSDRMPFTTLSCLASSRANKRRNSVYVNRNHNLAPHSGWSVGVVLATMCMYVCTLWLDCTRQEYLNNRFYPAAVICNMAKQNTIKNVWWRRKKRFQRKLRSLEHCVIILRARDTRHNKTSEDLKLLEVRSLDLLQTEDYRHLGWSGTGTATTATAAGRSPLWRRPANVN